MLRRRSAQRATVAPAGSARPAAYVWPRSGRGPAPAHRRGRHGCAPSASCGHARSTVATVLAGVGRRERDHLTPGARCLGFTESAQRCPAGIAAGRGKVAVPYHGADLHIFERDQVVGTQGGQRHRVVKVDALALDLLPCAGQQLHRRVTALGALRATTHAPLAPSRVPFSLCGSGADSRQAPHLP